MSPPRRPHRFWGLAKRLLKAGTWLVTRPSEPLCCAQHLLKEPLRLCQGLWRTWQLYCMQVEYFYRIHDPTTPDRQGNDRGTQYRSAIFYHDDDQKRIAEVCLAAHQR